jgi:hypothetical protein
MYGDILLTKLNTSDVLRLMEHLGVSESQVRYGNDCLIFPTVCHNELISNPSHKLYYYESSKRFYCYTSCKAMSIYEMILNTYKARGVKATYAQAYTLLDAIVNERMKHGFAVIQNPTAKPNRKITEDWTDQLTVYNPHVLECFTQQPKYLAPWLEEGIDYDVLCDFGVKFDMVRNRIVFPVIDHLGRLVGIKVRNFNQKDIEEHRKYMPLWHNKELYNYPKMMVAYGYYQNQKVIKKAKEVIVYEAEKSVLKHGSYFTQNKSIAIGGSSFSDYHAQILKDAGVEKIVLAMDNDWDEDGNRFYGLDKMLKEGFKILDMGFDVEIMYDWDGDQLGNKDAPIDRGRQVYSKLYRERKHISNFTREESKEEPTGEVSTENEELQ